jgi:hypothetical protein
MNKKEVKISDFIAGTKERYQRAKIIMPLLVKLAKTGNTIYYAELAGRTGIGIKFPLVLKHPLGAIGRVLISLSKETGVDIPPLQSIVVN